MQAVIWCASPLQQRSGLRADVRQRQPVLGPWHRSAWRRGAAPQAGPPPIRGSRLYAKEHDRQPQQVQQPGLQALRSALELALGCLAAAACAAALAAGPAAADEVGAARLAPGAAACAA